MLRQSSLISLLFVSSLSASDLIRFDNLTRETTSASFSASFVATDYLNNREFVKSANLPAIERILLGFGLMGPEQVIATNFGDKQAHVNGWASLWPMHSDYGDSERRVKIEEFGWYDGYVLDYQQSWRKIQDFLNDNLGYLNNLAYVEAVLQGLFGAKLADLANMTMRAKQGELCRLLKLTCPAVSAPVVDLGESKVDAGYLATRRGTELRNRFQAAVGLNWRDARISRPLNGAEMREAPRLNKYNEGPWSSNLIILESPYGLFKSKIPTNIKSALAAIPDSEIKLYVEIDEQWDWEKKARRVNLLFHGAMIDWYKGEVPAAFDFNGVFAKDLPMGVFDLSGASPVDLAVDRLSPLNVNAHNQLYSPDNAGLVASAGRQVVTFWSVAKSDEKKRAVVTFHILFNHDLLNNFANQVLNISYQAATLGDLLRGLKNLIALVPAGADRDAWSNGVRVLEWLYGSV